MPDPLTKVQPGQRLRISAAAYNAFVDAARSAQERTLPPAQPQPARWDSDVVWVKNTASPIGRNGVLGIDSIVIGPVDNLDEFKQHPVLSCSTPSTAHLGKFVITLEPIGTGEIGRAVVGGMAVVQIEVIDASHAFAEVKNGDGTKLQSVAQGTARILYKEPGTGTRWAVVRLADEGLGLTSGSGHASPVYHLICADSATVGFSHSYDPDTGTLTLSATASRPVYSADEKWIHLGGAQFSHIGPFGAVPVDLPRIVCAGVGHTPDSVRIYPQGWKRDATGHIEPSSYDLDYFDLPLGLGSADEVWLHLEASQMQHIGPSTTTKTAQWVEQNGTTVILTWDACGHIVSVKGIRTL